MRFSIGSASQMTPFLKGGRGDNRTRSPASSLTVILVGVLFGAIVFVRCTSKTPELQSSGKSGAEPKFVEDEDSAFLAHGVAHHFSLARGDLEQKDFEDAADEIRTGAAILNVETLRATSPEEQSLLDSSEKLKKLADEVEKGSISSTKELDNAFAYAHVALAEHYQTQASLAANRKDYRAAANFHKAAAVHLDAKHNITPAVKIRSPQDNFRAARENFGNGNMKAAADEVRKGAAFLGTETGHATGERLKDLIASGKELDRLANDLENGAVPDAGKLDEPFARACLALAKHYDFEAAIAMERKNYDTATDIHRAASLEFEYLIKLGNREKAPAIKQ